MSELFAQAAPAEEAVAVRPSSRVAVHANSLAVVTLAGVAFLLLWTASEDSWLYPAGAVVAGFLTGFVVRDRSGKLTPAVLAGLSLCCWVSFIITFIDLTSL